MITKNIRIKKYEYCGNFFIPKGHYNVKYCNRTNDIIKRSCKDIASSKLRNKRINEDPIELAYKRAYKRMNKRLERGKIDQSEFFDFIREADNMKIKCKNKEISLDEFIRFLDAL